MLLDRKGLRNNMKKGYRLAAIAVLSGLSFTTVPAFADMAPAQAAVVAPTKVTTLGSLKINNTANITVNKGTKSTIKPNYVTSGTVKVTTARLTVYKNGKRLVYKQGSASLGAGKYKVTTKVFYKVQLKNGSKKYWSSTKSKSLTQTLVITEKAGVSTTPAPTKTTTPAPIKTTTPTTPTQTITPVVSEATVVSGIDVSGHTATNDWLGWKKSGYQWVITKATEGTSYKSPKFSTQFSGAKSNGFIRGAYHFAIPTRSTGAAQADYFISQGGGWTKDGQTLPGTLDIEWNPYKSIANGNVCYGMSQDQMSVWIDSFVKEYEKKTGVKPMIYTSTNWWTQCVGTKYTDSNSPVWLASYSTVMGSKPYPWINKKHTIWQYAAFDAKGYDVNRYNGTYSSLKKFAETGKYDA